MSSKSDVQLPVDRHALVEISNLTVIVVITALAALRFVLSGGAQAPLPAFLVVFGCIINAIYIRRNGSINSAAWVLVTVLLIGLFYGAFSTGAFSGPIVILSPLIPIFTILLINIRAACITIGLVFVVLMSLLYLQYNGLIPANTNRPELILFGRFITLLSLSLVSTWIVWNFSRITHHLLKKVELQSNTDYLTGISNRRGIETILAHELGRARRNNEWLSFVMADVDRFKLYNDTNGHQAGDHCLTVVAQAIQSCIKRTTDVVGRFGGEEFVVILPNTDIEGANKIAECIRLEMLNQKISYGPKNPEPVSLTLGVVSGRGYSIDTIEQLVRLADDAL